MKSTRLKGRVSLVTGGSRGIGRAIARRLAAEGASVGVNYRSRADAAEETVELISAAGGRAVAVAADVAVEAEVHQMVRKVASELGPIDILVNNAGLLYAGQLLEHNEDEFDQMWRTNVKGVVYASAAAAPSMTERGWGRIINLSSNAAVGTSMPGTTLYAATKGAVLSLTKRFALELGPSGVTVNAILPGFTLTEMVSAGKDEEQMRRTIDRVTELSMLRRIGEPDDIAATAAFLASDDAAFMTAQFLLADGGRMDYLAAT